MRHELLAYLAPIRQPGFDSRSWNTHRGLFSEEKRENHSEGKWMNVIHRKTVCTVKVLKKEWL
jgi:hypothetical protein